MLERLLVAAAGTVMGVGEGFLVVGRRERMEASRDKRRVEGERRAKGEGERRTEDKRLTEAAYSEGMTNLVFFEPAEKAYL